jgi:hypothetical protein
MTDNISKKDIIKAEKLGRLSFNKCTGHHLGIMGNPTNAPIELVRAYNNGYQLAKMEKMESAQ